MSPNYCNDQLCDAKMDDPESPESQESKRDLRMVNGKPPLSRTKCPTPVNGEDSKDFHHHHHHGPPFTPQSPLEEDGEGDDGDMSTDDMISVGGSPSPALESRRPSHRSRNSGLDETMDDYFRPFIKLRMVKVEPPSSTTPAGLKSFSISDILSHKPSKSPTTPNHHGNSMTTVQDLVVSQQRIVRPWDGHGQLQNHHHHHRHHHGDHGGGQTKSNGRRNSDSSPLDALFQMTSKTFEGLNGHHDGQDIGSGGGNAHQAFNSRQPPKKKRKSRTAFTNHQIFELEKRFLYQKYLSPADRDDIAQHLGLTNAQVITWFQNRRAKLKRDTEEQRKDLESAKIILAQNSLMESVQELGNLRKRVQSHVEMMNPAAAVAAAVAAASFRISSPSSSFSSHSPINLTSESPPSTH